MRSRLALLLAAIAFGVITTNVDSDPAGIASCSIAGAHYGYRLLWMLPLAIVALASARKMGPPPGLVAGNGLADLIREKTGGALDGSPHRSGGFQQPGQHRQRFRGRGCLHGGLLPTRSLAQTVLTSQRFNGAILPIALIGTLRLVIDRAHMGKCANGRI